MSVWRLDTATLGSPTVDDFGVLHVEAYATRAGVFTYADPNGGVRREYRPETEVFSETSMQSIMGAPVTIGHVDMITPANARMHRVGVVEGEPRRDGALMAIKLRLDDPRVIEQVMAGTLRELSLGYKCDVEQVSGTTAEGRYDMIQKNLRNNHVALLPAGKARAGSACSIRLDSADAEEVKEEDKDKDKSEEDKTVNDADGSPTPLDNPEPTPEPEPAPEPEAPPADPFAAERAAYETSIAELRSRVASLEALLTSAVERADSSDKTVKGLRRSALERDVKSVLPAVRVDGVSDSELRQMVISKFLPGVRLDAKASEERADALFVAAMSIAAVEPKKQVAGALTEAPKTAADARAEMLARHKTMACGTK